VREKLIDFIQREYPAALPHSRQIAFKDSSETAAVSENAGRRIHSAG